MSPVPSSSHRLLVSGAISAATVSPAFERLQPSSSSSAVATFSKGIISKTEIHASSRYLVSPAASNHEIVVAYYKSPPQRAWEDLPSPTVTASSSDGVLSELAEIHPSSPSSMSNSSSRIPMVRQVHTSTPATERSLAAIINVFSTYVLLYLIAYCEPAPALLFVNKASNKAASSALARIIYHKFLAVCGLKKEIPHTHEGVPVYEDIRRHLSKHYQTMQDEYHARLPLLKRQDYTSRMLKQTTPFGIFPQIYIDWSSDGFEKRKAEFNPYATVHLPSEFNALRRVDYFLSITPMPGNKKTRELFEAPEIIKELLVDDPRYVDRLFRYIFDQIYCSINQTLAYPEGLYNMVNLLLKHHANNLSYELLHYALLIHIHLVLFHANIDENIDKNKLGLIDAMLTQIKLAAPEKMKSRTTDLSDILPALKQHLQSLFTHKQQAARTQAIRKMDKSSQSMVWKTENHGKNLQRVVKIIQKHFRKFSVEIPSSTSQTGSCVIS